MFFRSLCNSCWKHSYKLHSRYFLRRYSISFDAWAGLTTPTILSNENVLFWKNLRHRCFVDLDWSIHVVSWFYEETVLLVRLWWHIPQHDGTKGLGPRPLWILVYSGIATACLHINWSDLFGRPAFMQAIWAI